MSVNTLIDSLAAPPSAPEVEQKEMRNDDALPLRVLAGKRPLFLVHELFGNVAYATKIEQFIDSQISIYALPGESIVSARLRTVEGIAFRLIKLIKAVQPEGPYSIAGWSFGGIVAIEIAKQLIGNDEDIAFLGLLDTCCYSFSRIEKIARELDEQRASDILMDLCRTGDRSYIERLFSFDNKSGTKQQDFYELSFERDYLIELKPKEVRYAALRLPADLHAWAQYTIQPLPISVYLFYTCKTARNIEVSSANDSKRGWEAFFSKDEIHTIAVSGAPQTLMTAPHIEILGKSISSALYSARNAKHCTVESGHSPLAPIQIRTGKRPPLFCVPGAGATVFSFVQFAGVLGENWRIYGLQPRGIDGKRIPHTTVPAAAEYYLRAINEAQPQGPIHLLGHSFGGWVVLEIALRMQAINRPIASLSIIDSEAPGTRCEREYSRIEVLMDLIEIFERDAERCLGINRIDIENLDEGRQLELLHRKLVRIGTMSPRSEALALRGPLYSFAACRRAQYRPAAAHYGPVNFVRVEQEVSLAGDSHFHLNDAIEEWKQWAPNIMPWRGPGNHMTILKQPHVQSLAQR